MVRKSRVSTDWESIYKGQLKRITVLVQPLPESNQNVGAMFARVARRYVHMKRNFLVKSDSAKSTADWKAECGEGIDGVLLLRPLVESSEKSVTARTEGSLLKCGDGSEAWSGEVAGKVVSEDEGLKEVAANYGRENGPEVVKYVPAAMHLLRPLLDTLPQPELNDADVDEKLTLDE